AVAAPEAPEVETSTSGTFILGEDTSVDIDIRNGSSIPTYNLSDTVLLPSDVTVVEPTPFGSMVTYPAGFQLPGGFADTTEDCADLRLDSAGAFCSVPAGMQFLVFQNFSDLPAS